MSKEVAVLIFQSLRVSSADPERSKVWLWLKASDVMSSEWPVKVFISTRRRDVTRSRQK